jgi:flagellar hook-basal body complex protein FliE
MLVVLCGGVFAAFQEDEPLTETLTFNTAAGYAELTVVKAGAQDTGGEMEFSKGVITVTSDKGLVKDHSFAVYKTGVMNVILASSANAHITKVEMTLSNCYPFAEPTGWTTTYSTDYTYDSSTKVAAGTTVTYTTTATDITSLTFTNASGGKTDLRKMIVYYVKEASAEVDYYVVGSMTEWGVLETFKMEANPQNEGEYMLTKSFAAGDELKIKDSNDNWYPGDGIGNYKLTKDGTHTIYFRPDGQGGDGWYNGYIYVDDSQATEPEPVVTEAKYYVVGSFNSWSSTEGMLEMTLDATNNTYTYTGTFDAGVGIKVIKVEGQTTTWYPEGMNNEYTINIAGEHTIVFNPQTGEYTVSDDEATPVETVADGYYLVGSFSDWKAKADYAFAENAGAAGEYMLTTTLTAGNKMKVVKLEGGEIKTWYPDGENNDYEVKVTGSHTIYFRPDGQGGNDWFNGVFYVDGEDVPVGSYSLTCTNTENVSIDFKLGDTSVTTANPMDQISAFVTLADGYAVDVENTKVEAWASFEDAQTPLMAPGILRNIDFTYDEEANVISFTMPEANVRVTVATIVDKTELEETIDDAKDLLNQIDDQEIANTLQEAIDAAQAVDDKADATAAEVAKAVQDLKDAMDAAQRALDALKVSVTVKAGEFVTMYLEKNRKVEETETGVKLYTVTSVNVEEEKVVLSSELSVVGDKTPFLLYNEGTTDATVTLVVAGTPDQVTVAPEFKGTLEAKTFTAAELEAADYYTLHGQNFVWTPEAGTIAANRCWLQLDKSAGAPASLTIVFDDDTTGINVTTVNGQQTTVYDLNGRRVAQPTKGLYIINGKKVVIK